MVGTILLKFKLENVAQRWRQMRF